MLITIMASIFALLLTCMNYSSINVEDDTFPPVKRNLVIKWDAFVSNATKNLREKIPINQLASTQQALTLRGEAKENKPNEKEKHKGVDSFDRKISNNSPLTGIITHFLQYEQSLSQATSVVPVKKKTVERKLMTARCAELWR